MDTCYYSVRIKSTMVHHAVVWFGITFFQLRSNKSSSGAMLRMSPFPRPHLDSGLPNPSSIPNWAPVGPNLTAVWVILASSGLRNKPFLYKLSGRQLFFCHLSHHHSVSQTHLTVCMLRISAQVWEIHPNLNCSHDIFAFSVLLI